MTYPMRPYVRRVLSTDKFPPSWSAYSWVAILSASTHGPELVRPYESHAAAIREATRFAGRNAIAINRHRATARAFDRLSRRLSTLG